MSNAFPPPPPPSRQPIEYAPVVPERRPAWPKRRWLMLPMWAWIGVAVLGVGAVGAVTDPKKDDNGTVAGAPESSGNVIATTPAPTDPPSTSSTAVPTTIASTTAATAPSTVPPTAAPTTPPTTTPPTPTPTVPGTPPPTTRAATVPATPAPTVPPTPPPTVRPFAAPV